MDKFPNPENHPEKKPIHFEIAKDLEPNTEGRPSDDDLLVRPEKGFFAVFDGVSEKPESSEAVEIAKNKIEDSIMITSDPDNKRGAQLQMNAVLSAAHREVRSKVDGALALASARIWADKESGQIFGAISRIGDCRVYLFREGTLQPLTLDEGWMANKIKAEADGESDRGKALQKQSELSNANSFQEILSDPYLSTGFKKRNKILNAMGHISGWVADRTEVFDLENGDVLLLCTDGLHKAVKEVDIEAQLQEEKDLVKANRNLVAMSRRNTKDPSIFTMDTKTDDIASILVRVNA